MSQYNYIIPEELSGFRLDKAMSILCSDASRSQIQKAIKSGQVLLNNQIILNISNTVKDNDTIQMLLTEKAPEGIVATNIKLDIIYEDSDLIVINKSANMTVHPGAGDYTDTLVNALLFYTQNLSDIGGEIRPGIVHRLDKNTSGLMVVAKNNKAHANLAQQIESRGLVRKYKALVWGMLKPQSGVINAPMGRSQADRKKMTTLRYGGKDAITHYKTTEILRAGLFSLVECTLETGRTHQIRVHLSSSGHSVFGDQTYGNNKRKIQGCPEELKEKLLQFNHQALHSFYISFTHPVSGQVMEFEKDLPVEYHELVDFIRSSS